MLFIPKGLIPKFFLISKVIIPKIFFIPKGHNAEFRNKDHLG